jgi:hypothetical protein
MQPCNIDIFYYKRHTILTALKGGCSTEKHALWIISLGNTRNKKPDIYTHFIKKSKLAHSASFHLSIPLSATIYFDSQIYSPIFKRRNSLSSIEKILPLEIYNPAHFL